MNRARRLWASAVAAAALIGAGATAGASPSAPAPSTTTTTTTTTTAPTTSTSTPSPPQTVSGQVQRASQPIPEQYIVTLKDVPSAGVPSESEQLAAKHGGSVFHVYQHALQGFAVRMNPEQAGALAREPNVAAVQQDGIVHVTTTETPSPSCNPVTTSCWPWGIDRVDQHALPLDNAYQYGGTGSGVTAYVIDTGIQTSVADFGGRASYGIDVVAGSTQPHGTDCNGHGTHVAGTLAGTTYGVAKQVSLVEVRVLDCNGNGADSDVVAGVEWITANAVKPAVANLSLGGPIASPDALGTAVKASISSGVVYAVAAGNSGIDACQSSPANVGGTQGPALTVAASDINDAQASFSNFGTCVNLYAPGTSIVSDAPGTNSTLCALQATCMLSGTSMATPHVAGTAALYLGAHSSATPAQVAAVVTSDATPNKISNASAGTPNLLDYTGPGAPSLTATPASNSVQLSWTVPADGGSPITNYRIYKGTSSGAETLLTTVNGSTTSYTDSSFACSGTYFYQVSAVTAVDETRSAERSAAPTGVLPCPPTLTATPGAQVVHLSWNPVPNAGSLTAFKVYRGTSSGGEAATPIATLSPSTTSYDDAQVTNGTTYYYQVSAVNPSGETRSAEKSATPQTAVWEFALGPDHAVWDQQFINGSGSGPQSLGGYLVSNIATVSNSSGVTIFSQGADGRLWDQQFNGSWSGWQSLGGATSSNPAAVTNSTGTWVFIRGPGNAIWYQQLTNAGWSGWQYLGGAVDSNPAAVTDSSGISVFVRGPGSAIWYQRYTNSNATWSGWQYLGGAVYSDPTAVADSSGTWVFVTGPGNAIWYQHYTNSNATWSGWQYLGGAIYSNSAATADASGVWLFVRGPGNAIWYQHYTSGNASWSGWQTLGGATGGNPSAVTEPSGIWVFAQGPGSAPWYRRYSSASWANWQTLGGPIISDPASTFG